jgi:glycosyltransferase involved in cell wall biosynthesis
MQLFFIDYYNELNNNGLNTYTSQLIGLLEKQQIISIHIIWINSKKFKDLKSEYINSVNNIHIPQNLGKQESTIQICKVLSDQVGLTKNILVHLNWITHLSLAWHLKQKIDCKIILTKHCLPWRDLVTNEYKEFYRLNEAYIKGKDVNLAHPNLKQEQVGYNSIDHIITVTQCAKFSLTHLFKIRAEKITVIPNGIETQAFLLKKNRAKLRTQYGFNLNERIILFAGNIHSRKGIMDAVKGFDSLVKTKSFENLRLVIAGPGDYGMVLKTAKKSWAKITLTGSLPKATLYDFYAMADIGIAPSYAEQCSYTVIEMMNAGLPLIVSDVDGLKEMVNANCGLRIKVDFKKKGASINAKDLKEKIGFLLENPDLAKQLATNAKQYALQHFTAERMAKDTIAVYEKVLAEGELKNQSQKEKGENNHGSFVSVIIPCYNAEKYIAESIKSVLTQNYTHFELVVIDDGSTDHSSKLITAFKDKRIIYSRNHQNKGFTYTLNKAIKLAKGKYIARLDADDVMLPNRLALQVDFLEKNSDYGMVGGYHYEIDTYGMPIQKIEPYQNNEELKLNLLFSNPFAHPVITMRSDVVKALNYNGNFKYCEDYDLWFRIAEKYKLKNLPCPLLNYRVLIHNSSANNSKLMKQNVLNLLSRELDKMGISHSMEELMIHAAISFKYKSKYFNTDEKIKSLHHWLDRIFTSQKLINNYSQHQLKKFKKHILTDYCGFL